MGQIHALLFITGQALCTDQIMERLGISRGNANMNLRQLLDWGLIRRLHRTGVRREYFASEDDAWQIMRTICRERKRREFDPTLHLLRSCVGDANEMTDTIGDRCPRLLAYRDRAQAMLGLFRKLDQLYERFMPMPATQVSELLEVPVEGL
jgi:DNA-binding transcriptional regulator GbsR (MarR family)